MTALNMYCRIFLFFEPVSEAITFFNCDFDQAVFAFP